MCGTVRFEEDVRVIVTCAVLLCTDDGRFFQYVAGKAVGPESRDHPAPTRKRRQYLTSLSLPCKEPYSFLSYVMANVDAEAVVRQFDHLLDQGELFYAPSTAERISMAKGLQVHELEVF